MSTESSSPNPGRFAATRRVRPLVAAAVALLGAGSLSAVLLSQFAFADTGGGLLSQSSAQRAAIMPPASPAMYPAAPGRPGGNAVWRFPATAPTDSSAYDDHGGSHHEAESHQDHEDD